MGDIMARLGWLETLELSFILKSTAGDLAAVFASNPYTHMFVMAPGNQGGVRRIRGLISRTRLERHLGTSTRVLLSASDNRPGFGGALRR